MPEVYVYMIPLPDGINSFTTPCADGYTVYIDPRLDKDRQMKAYMHELEHIAGKDFEGVDVQDMERRARL